MQKYNRVNFGIFALERAIIFTIFFQKGRREQWLTEKFA